LREAEQEERTLLAEIEDVSAERLYAELTSRLIAVERDLVNFPITYHVSEADERFSLPAVAPYLLELAERGTGGPTGPARLRARLLRDAVDDFAATTAAWFDRASSATTEERLREYAPDHMRAD
jgi:hypothetical protein